MSSVRSRNHAAQSSVSASHVFDQANSDSSLQDFSRAMLVETPGTWPALPEHTRMRPQPRELAAPRPNNVAKSMSVRVRAKQVASRHPISPHREAAVSGSLDESPSSIDSPPQKKRNDKFRIHNSGVLSPPDFRTSGPVLRPVHYEGWVVLKVKKQNILETAPTESDTFEVTALDGKATSKKKVPRRSSKQLKVSVSRPTASTPTAPDSASVPPTPGTKAKKVDPHLPPHPTRDVGTTTAAQNAWPFFSSTGHLYPPPLHTSPHTSLHIPRTASGGSVASLRTSSDIDSDSDTDTDTDRNDPDDVKAETRDSVGDLEGVRRHLSESEMVSRACTRAEKAAANWKAQGQYAVAVDSYSDALEYGVGYSREKRAKLYFVRAECYEELGLYRKAVRDYSESLELVPNSIPALAHRAFLLESLDRYSSARADYELLKRLVPQNRQYAAGAIRVARFMY